MTVQLVEITTTTMPGTRMQPALQVAHHIVIAREAWTRAGLRLKIPVLEMLALVRGF